MPIYACANPSHDNRSELKLAYMAEIDDSWRICSGVCLSHMQSRFSQESRDNLIRFVDSAADLPTALPTLPAKTDLVAHLTSFES